MLGQGPLIVQSDMEILVEVANEFYEKARDAIAPFTELIKSPEHLHTYRISHLSLWNAASSGLKFEDVEQRLNEFCKFPVPPSVFTEIREYMSRYGKVKLIKKNEYLILRAEDPDLMYELSNLKKIEPFVLSKLNDEELSINPVERGNLKMVLTNLGFPVEDLAGYVIGDPLEINLRKNLLQDKSKAFELRNYQKESAEVFYASGGEKGGSGVIVLPCGAGKTIVGIAAMSLIQTKTLILTPNITSARQWMREILDKTHLEEGQIKEYSGEHKEIGDVTVATYQIMTQKKSSEKSASHFSLFEQNKWGLMIYDEVHLLPAPVFRVSANMQATRRLGLTATLVREDGKEKEVFSLIGPKKYDVPWKALEEQGWIANAICEEVRILMAKEEKMQYAVVDMREKIKLASCNKRKSLVVRELLSTHSNESDRVLIIGQYIDQLESLAEELDVPLITGKTKNAEREVVYGQFRNGEINVLMVSKVGNFAIDLPDANVLIQISGTFGSRQEEAQRLGRVLRPKKDGSQAYFYSLVSKETREQEFAMKRQLFLAEQGYEYKITSWDKPEAN